MTRAPVSGSCPIPTESAPATTGVRYENTTTRAGRRARERPVPEEVGDHERDHGEVAEQRPGPEPEVDPGDPEQPREADRQEGHGADDHGERGHLEGRAGREKWLAGHGVDGPGDRGPEAQEVAEEGRVGRGPGAGREDHRDAAEGEPDAERAPRGQALAEPDAGQERREDRVQGDHERRVRGRGEAEAAHHAELEERVADEPQEDEGGPLGGARSPPRRRGDRHDAEEDEGGDRAPERGEGDGRDHRLNGLDGRIGPAPDQDDQAEGRGDGRPAGRAGAGPQRSAFMSSGKFELNE